MWHTGSFCSSPPFQQTQGKCGKRSQEPRVRDWLPILSQVFSEAKWKTNTRLKKDWSLLGCQAYRSLTFAFPYFSMVFRSSSFVFFWKYQNYVLSDVCNGHNCPATSVDLWQLSIQPETLDGSEMPHDPFAKITGIGKAMRNMLKELSNAAKCCRN